MLPNFLHSSLKTYKEDTNTIACWLAVKAKQCGYPSDLLDNTGEPSSVTSSNQTAQPSGRLKGNARKKAKAAAKNVPDVSKDHTDVPVYIIKIREFVGLAEWIVGFKKPVVSVPRNLVVALDRAIALRKRHNDWSREGKGLDCTTDRANDADESHSYFLGILEQTREILKPRMPSDVNDEFLSKPSGDTKKQSIDEIKNSFANLDVQEPTQAFIDAPDVVPESKATSEPRYEAEILRSIEELYLATHCLFQDVRNIRSFLRLLWSNYLEGLDIVAVSLTTNTAIDFVRNLEQEYLLQFPDQSDYTAIVKIFYGPQCSIRGEDPDHRQHPEDLFNFAVYDLAEECLLTTYTVLAAVQEVISPGQLPIYKAGLFGRRDLGNDWVEKQPREKFSDDKLVIFEAFTDLMVMTMISSKSPLAEDELIRGFRNMAPGKNIPLWLVFATQCFLDAQHILKKDVVRPHAQLLQTANAISASVNQNLKFHQSLRAENWPRTNDFQFKETLRVNEEWIQRDVVAEKLKKMRRNLSVPDPEPFQLLKQYPLLCGLFIFAIKMQFQDVSLAFVNAWGSVLYTAHLYNASRQEGFLPRVWKDMEMVISLQSPERMFVGNAPRQLDEYLKRFILSMGYSASIFASNRSRGGLAASPRGPRSLMELGKVGALFKGRYCKNDANVSWTSESMKAIIEAKFDDDSDEESTEKDGKLQPKADGSSRKSQKAKQSATGALLKRPKRDRKSVPTVDFLEDLANALHAEALELTFDYLRLHRFCWILLRQVNDTCKPKLLEMYGPGYLPKECDLPWMVGYIFMTATNTSRIADVLLPRRGTGKVSSQLLALAAEQIKGMVDGGAGAIQLKVLQEFLGYGIEMEGLDDADGTS